jgi:phospho-N-acetylmuramoyl-pentapeptide-transferase
MLSTWAAEYFGIALFSDRLFRAGASALFAAMIVFLLMPKFIAFLQAIDATSDFDRDRSRRAPPICGGLLVVASVLLSTLIFAIPNGYMISISLILIAYTAIGGLDDLMKVKAKRLVMAGKLEKKDYQDKADGISSRLRLGLYFLFSLCVAILAYKLIPGLDAHLTVPFIKKEVWYPYLPNWAFILLISFVTTSTANGANFTDGLDTLVSVPIITSAIFIGAVAYISGNKIFSEYLLLPHLPGVDELLPIAAAIIGATIAYLWYNCPPAEIYMGDGGSIGLGGAIGMMFVLVKAELFLPIIGLIFVAEAMSVVLQISGFKLSRKFSKDRIGRRIFLRAPIHDHFKLSWKAHYGAEHVNSKVIWRFHIISILGLILGSLIFFKVR